MHLTSLATAVLVSANALVSAAGLLGFSLGSNNPDGSCKSQADFAADLKAIRAESGSSIVRIYAASQCDTAKNILPAAKQQSAQVVLGIWPDTEDSFSKDKAAVAAYAPQFKDQVYAVIVGSETMYRKTFTGEQLLAKIKDVKSAVPGFKVGTADTWNKFQDGTADTIIKGGADILFTNAFSYWQGQNINNATTNFLDDIWQAFGHIQAVSGSTDKIELWVGETGWTTAGDKYQNAVPSVENAALFYRQGVCGLVNWGFNVFFFEAFDEPGKPKSIGDDGSAADETHWGAMNADRHIKYPLKC